MPNESNVSVETNLTMSQKLFDRALKVMPGGVSRNTIFRLPNPSYVRHGQGCTVTDVEGVQKTDFANNMCALIHGHAHPAITEAVTEQLAKGTAFTMATEAELKFAELLCHRIPHVDKIRFMNSGTEAVMVAIKASRCFTGRPKIAKVEGAYHGTYDYAEVSQKSSPENWGDPTSPSSVPVALGTPSGALDDVVVIPFNNIEQSLELLDRNAAQIACVMIDPLPHRVGLIPATKEYIKAIRDWTTRNGSLLVFDEVITFRMGYSGAADWFQDKPDLVCLGKIIGGGFPVGALGGRDDVMAVLNPMQKVIPFPHSGTFSANPITMTAGRVALELFDQQSVDQLNRLGELMRQKLNDAITQSGIPACVTGAGSMFRLHLKPGVPKNYRETFMDATNVRDIKILIDFMYENGFMLINTFSGALSTAMVESDILGFAETLKGGFAKLKG